MLLSTLLTLAGISLASPMASAMMDGKFIDELTSQKPLTEDKFERGDFSGSLRTYKVEDPAAIGCESLLESGRSAYQVASLRTALKQFDRAGELTRVKVKEQVFNMEPALSDIVFRDIDDEMFEEMREGCGELTDRDETDTSLSPDEFVTVKPIKEVARIEVYADGELAVTEDIRGNCHMPTSMENAFLNPGAFFAVKMAGRVHDNSLDGEDEFYAVYLKTKLEKLADVDYDALTRQRQLVSDPVQWGIAITVTLAVLSVVACGIYTVVKQIMDPEKGLQKRVDEFNGHK